MSESQSRYSIVERLTKQKLDIMTAKANLIDEITQAEQSVVTMEADIVEDKKVIESEAKKHKTDLDRALKGTKNNVKNLKGRQGAKGKLFERKISAIDDALIKLEDISKSQS